MRKGILLAILLLVVFSSMGAKAASDSPDFAVNVKSIKDTIKPTERAQYEIQIKNKLEENRTFVIYTQGLSPSWEYLESYMIKAGPNKTGSTTLYVSPSKTETAGRRGFYIYVYPQEKENASVKQSVILDIVRDKKLVFLTLSTKKSNYEPEEKVKVFTTVKNVGRKKISKYKVNFSLNGKSEIVNVPYLDSGDSAELQTSFKLGKYYQGEYIVEAETLSGENEVEDSMTTKINVPGKVRMKRTEEVTDMVLWKDVEVKIKNVGNLKSELEYLRAKFPSFIKPIVSTVRKPDKIRSIDGETVYEWKVRDLNPGEIQSVNYRLNYWVVIAIIGLIVLISAFAYMELKVATLTKRARKVDSEHSVHIIVENNTGGKIENAKVKDFVPGIAKLIEKFDSAKPNSIKKKEEGTEIVWELGSLDPGEERVLTYRIKPVVQVEGSIRLPKAEMDYKTKRGEKKSSSHRATAEFT